MSPLHDARPRDPHRSQATDHEDIIERRNGPPVTRLTEAEAIACARRIGKFTREVAALTGAQDEACEPST